MLHKRLITYITVSVFLLVGGVLLRDLEWQGSQGLHTLMESLATLLAFIVGAMSLVRFLSLREEKFLYIGAGFIGTAFLDLYHTLVTTTYLQDLMPTDYPNLVPWSWMASRLFLSILLCFSSFILYKKNNKDGAAPVTVFLLTGLATIVCFLLFSITPLPEYTIQSTVMPRSVDLIPATFFLLAFIGYLNKGIWRTDSFEHWLILSIIVGFATQAAFMPFSAEVNDAEFNIAHVLKKISYISVLIGLMISLHKAYQNMNIESNRRQRSEKITQETNERLNNALNAGLMGTWNVDMHTGMDTRDASLNQLVGLPAKSSKQPVADWFKYVHPDDTAEMDEAWEQAISSESGLYETEHRLIRKDGKIIWVYDRGQMIRDNNGQVQYAVGAVVDITNRKISQEKLQLSSSVFNSTSEGIVITDVDRVIIDVNPAFSEITGYSSEEVIGQEPRILSSGKQSPEFYVAMWQEINDSGHWQGEVWNRKKSGEVYAELLTISSLKDTKNNIINYVGLFTDITNSKLQQDHIKKMAHFDALTSLPNRSLLTDRFNQALAHSKRSGTLLAVCFLDLDDFKPVNDNYGHEVGDKLLIEVAARLESTVREEDTVSRLGGDEFSLLLGEIKSTAQCYELLERITQSVSAPYFIGGESINISASVGVSLFPTDNVELDVLLRNADQAMYQAKQEGKSNYRFFDADEAQRTAQQHLKLQEIQHALINHELCMYYQPKVNMATGEITGLEALIRWQHPDKGLIPPLDFLPLLEGSELEIQVGDWVIEQGLTQLEWLNDHGIEIEISVNVSSNQFLSASFFGNLDDALNRHHNIDSRYFQLEVLESSALGNLEQIHTIIKACRNKLGISIALDDFGTGYSSLSHLSTLPVDTVKIDQGFVRDVLDDSDDFAIINGVIGLANSFNKHFIAEGVETIDHGLMLLLMGCNDAQGYAISRPMPTSKLIDWINNYNPNQDWVKSSQEEMTLQARRIKQLQLILNHWIENIESFLRSGIDEQLDMSSVNCHFGRWIRRLRQEQLFNDAWFDQLEQAHDVMHFVAKELVEGHQVETRPAKDDLNRLHVAFEKTLTILEQYHKK